MVMVNHFFFLVMVVLVKNALIFINGWKGSRSKFRYGFIEISMTVNPKPNEELLKNLHQIFWGDGFKLACSS